jgi:hypothetical protein
MESRIKSNQRYVSAVQRCNDWQPNTIAREHFLGKVSTDSVWYGVMDV